MFQRRRAKVLLALLVVVALALITLDFRGGDDGATITMRSSANSVLSPVQDGVSALVRPFENLGDQFSDIFSTRSENQSLREQITELEERRRSVVDLERENEELRELLDIGDRTNFETVAARTVALSPSNFEWTITIDVGSDDGIERDMPVINGEGLVGRVVQVASNSANVLLAIDPNFSSGARSARTAEVGWVDGRGGDPMSFQPLDPEADIEPGDEIVTSSYQGGVFPAGIPIGTATEVNEAGTGLALEVDVSPFVDFTRIHHVMVVMSEPVDELPELDGTEDFDFTPPDVSPTPEADADTDNGSNGDAGAQDDENGDEEDGDPDAEGDGADADEVDADAADVDGQGAGEADGDES